MKRSNYIDWDKYVMGVASLSAMRSKDPNTQVGACIVNQKKRIVGIGYNGLPYGCDDDVFPWDNDKSFLESKYPYVVHAEPNAILNSTFPLDNCSIYVTLFPCHECVKLIIQSGIKERTLISDRTVMFENFFQQMVNYAGRNRWIEIPKQDQLVVGIVNQIHQFDREFREHNLKIIAVSGKFQIKRKDIFMHIVQIRIRQRGKNPIFGIVIELATVVKERKTVPVDGKKGPFGL